MRPLVGVRACSIALLRGCGQSDDAPVSTRSADIDPRQNPDGIDGANGSQISGSFTVGTAERLAATLRSGALPLALNLSRERRG